jgi:hypothetical protein
MNLDGPIVAALLSFGHSFISVSPITEHREFAPGGCSRTTVSPKKGAAVRTMVSISDSCVANPSRSEVRVGSATSMGGSPGHLSSTAIGTGRVVSRLAASKT